MTTSKRRAIGEGSVRQRPSGLYEVGLTVPHGDGSKRISVFGKTRRAALTAATEARKRAEAGAPVRDAARTLGEWLDHWLVEVLPHTGRRPSTVDTYGSLARSHIAPRLGHVSLRDLRPSTIQQALADIGAVRSPSTTRQVYAVLRACLDDAVKDGLLATNPCHRVGRPKVPRVELAVLQPSDVATILRAAEGHPWRVILLLIAFTGLRRGEALALRWTEVDLEVGSVAVTGTLSRTTQGLLRGEPKTARGWRRVPLPPDLVAALRAHRVSQAQERLTTGPDWAEGDWVFTTALGTPVEPRNLSRWYAQLATQAGVREDGLHALRHAAASMMLTTGTHVRVVADVLGHSDVAITLNTYAHALDGQALGAVSGVAAMIRGANGS